MNQQAAAELVEEIAGELRGAAPAGCAAMRTSFRVAGPMSVWSLTADDETGSAAELDPFLVSVGSAFDELREATYTPGRGAWFTAEWDGRVTVEYDYDNEPDFRPGCRRCHCPTSRTSRTSRATLRPGRSGCGTGSPRPARAQQLGASLSRAWPPGAARGGPLPQGRPQRPVGPTATDGKRSRTGSAATASSTAVSCSRFCAYQPRSAG